MAWPAVALLGTLLRGAGSMALRSFGRAGMGRTVAGSAAIHAAVRPRPVSSKEQADIVDIGELARKLGKAKPTVRDAAIQRTIQQRNLQEITPSGGGASEAKEFSKGLSGSAKSLTLVAGMGIGLALATRHLFGFAEEVFRASERLVLYNSTIANVMARSQRQRLKLDIQYAAGIAGTTRRLGESLMAVREQRLPYQIAGGNLKNLWGEFLETMKSKGYGFLEEVGLLKAIQTFNAVFGEEMDLGIQTDLRKFMGDIMQGKFGDKSNKRPLGPHGRRIP